MKQQTQALHATLSFSNAPGFLETALGKRLILADYCFTGFFTVEALVKMLSQGFIMAPNTYMRNGEFLFGSWAAASLLLRVV
jgi:hypothetical protein